LDEILYLEADEEITSVIDKLKGLEAKSIRLVAPKGSTIAQSMVSLKLLKKQAKGQGKVIALVTSDEVGRNLAGQIDLPVYADVKSTEPLLALGREEEENEPIEINQGETKENSHSGASEPKSQTAKADKESAKETENLPKDFQVHRYDDSAATLQDGKPAEVAPPIETPPEKVQEPKEESFIKRPVGTADSRPEKKHDIESARPVTYRDHEVKKSLAKKPKNWKTPVIITAVTILILAVLFIADLSIAKLTVSMSVVAETIDKEVTLAVEKDRTTPDFENFIIPGVQISKEKPIEQSFAATGEKDVGEKAKGTLTFKNESGVDETIAAGTTTTSTLGVEFTLDNAVNVSKASLNSAGDKVLGQATGSVTAKDSGTGGNLGASTSYVVSGHSKISATGATSGGITKKIKVVTKQDIEKAKKTLQEQEVSADELDKAKDDILLDGASVSEVSDLKTSKNAGDEADNFTASGKQKYTAITFKSDQFKEMVESEIEKGLPAGKGLLTTESDTITPSLKEAQINVGKLQVNGKLLGHVGPKLDISDLEKKWRFKTVNRIRRDLSGYEGVTVNSTELVPKYVLPIAPYSKKNIKINLEYINK